MCFISITIKNPYHQITHIACYYEEDDDDLHDDDDDYGQHDRFLLWSFYQLDSCLHLFYAFDIR